MTALHKFTLPSPLGRLPAGTSRDRDMAARLKDFMRATPAPFDRATLTGHITGSAFILNSERTKILLMHHAKLDRWLQPGGHCDGIEDVHFVALKEAYEETGLRRIAPISTEVFDVDVHEIPTRHDAPEHLHYDIRFLFSADEALKAPGNHESLGLDWFDLANLQEVAPSLVAPLKKLHREIV